MKQWLNEPAQLVPGLHPSLITDDLYLKANSVLEGRKRNMRLHDDKSDQFPLKGNLTCPVHGTSLTAYGVRGRCGKIHHYHLCTKCGSEQRHRLSVSHKSVDQILSTIQVSAEVVNLYKKVLEKVFERDDLIIKAEVTKIKADIEKFEQRRTNLQNQLLDGNIEVADYQDMKGRKGPCCFTG